MVRLCTHHQRQFIRVLNDIYTEVQPGGDGQRLPESGTMETSVCSSGCSQQCTETPTCSESKHPSSVDSDAEQSGPPGSLRLLGQTLKQAAELKAIDTKENFSAVGKRDLPDLSPIKLSSASPKDSPSQGYLTTSNSSSLNFHPVAKSPEGQALGSEPETGARRCEEDRAGIAARAAASAVTSEDSLDACLGAQMNSCYKVLPEETWNPSGFTASSPRMAGKENARQCSSKASLHQEGEVNDQEARPKQDNPLQALGKSKGGYLQGGLHPADKAPFDDWLPAAPAMPVLHKASNGHSRTKAASASIRTTRKSKRASGLRINDYDNQCDVVYISQPITECNFESQRSVSSRKTARKSTRGYYFNGECCELPTVRTLVRSSRGEERSSAPVLRTDVLLVPKQGIVLLSGSSPPGAAHAVEGDGDRRSPLQALLKEAPPCTGDKDSAEVSSLDSQLQEVSLLELREASPTRPSAALSPPPCPGNVKEDGSSASPAVATSCSPAERGKGRTWQPLERADADVSLGASSSPDPSRDCSDTVTADSALPSLSEAAEEEEGSLCLETPSTPEPPAGVDSEPPAGVDSEPPAGVDSEPPAGVDS
uniref:Uncharacterized protein n=1 Tax=Sphenodon punctatus TaxID=8508 RepID=A0A8D0H887_SPHPU